MNDTIRFRFARTPGRAVARVEPQPASLHAGEAHDRSLTVAIVLETAPPHRGGSAPPGASIGPWTSFRVAGSSSGPDPATGSGPDPSLEWGIPVGLGYHVPVFAS